MAEGTAIQIFFDYILPSLVAAGGVYLSGIKGRAEIQKLRAEAVKTSEEAEKTKSESGAISGTIFLQWTQEFKKRLDSVELINKKHEIKIEEQDKVIDKQSTALLIAEDKIHDLQKENEDLRNEINDLKGENNILRVRVTELEAENASLKKLKGEIK